MQQTSRPKLELAEIFRKYGEEYRSQHHLSSKQYSVMYDIEHCRTNTLGYHVNVCTQCGYEEHAYNSCRNRHCPKCQGIIQRKWIRARLENILPIPYYHVVFTLTHKVFPISLYNKRLFYDLLFDSAAQTLIQFGKDPRYLGALIGFYGILHTWGGQLGQHLHIHFIVTGGGLDRKGQWIEARHKGKFLFPVRALSRVFRGKFIQGLKSAYRDNELVFPDDYNHLNDTSQFETWVNSLVAQEWVVYVKKPFSGPEEIVRYIGRYTHRVAISNARLTSLKDGQIKFKYKNYRKKYKNGHGWEEISLSAEEFIRRFLMHVLPRRFHRIRHYGFLANGICRKAIKRIRRQLKGFTGIFQRLAKEVKLATIECPVCQSGVMTPIIAVTLYGTTIFRANMILFCS